MRQSIKFPLIFVALVLFSTVIAQAQNQQPAMGNGAGMTEPQPDSVPKQNPRWYEAVRDLILKEHINNGKAAGQATKSRPPTCDQKTNSKCNIVGPSL
jgi:hypothetical protein